MHLQLAKRFGLVPCPAPLLYFGPLPAPLHLCIPFTWEDLESMTEISYLPGGYAVATFNGERHLTYSAMVCSRLPKRVGEMGSVELAEVAEVAEAELLTVSVARLRAGLV